MVKKILKYNKLTIIVFLICISVMAASLVMTNYYKNKKASGTLDKAENYSTVISTNTEENGKYVYLRITKIPYLVAVEKIDNLTNEYYIVQDEDNYLYVVLLKKSTLKKIEDEYKKDPNNFSYMILGRIADVSYDLEKIIIDKYNEGSSETKLNRFNYSKYFGTTFLDENAFTPYSIAIGVSELCFFVFEIILFLYLIVIIRGLINIKNSLKNINKDEFERELLQDNIKEYSKAKILLLDNYFVSMDIGMNANKYSDIAWVYISHDTRTKFGYLYNSFSDKANIKVFLKNGKKYTTNSVKVKDYDIYSEIIDEIIKKNSDIMIGYSYENLNNYNRIKNKQK